MSEPNKQKILNRYPKNGQLALNVILNTYTTEPVYYKTDGTFSENPKYMLTRISKQTPITKSFFDKLKKLDPNIIETDYIIMETDELLPILESHVKTVKINNMMRKEHCVNKKAQLRKFSLISDFKVKVKGARHTYRS